MTTALSDNPEVSRPVHDDHERELAEILAAIDVTSALQFTLAHVPFSVTGGAAALAAAYGVAPPVAADPNAQPPIDPAAQPAQPPVEPAAAAPAPAPAQPQPPRQPVSPYAAMKKPAPSPLVSVLTTALYANCYCRPFRGSVDPPPDPSKPQPAPDQALIALLSAANQSHERWERGWRITQTHANGYATARRGEQTRSLWAGEFISHDGPGSPPRTGAEIDVFYARESVSLQPGTYHAFGEAAGEATGCLSIVRVYFNLTPEAAPVLVRAVTTRFNRFAVPFRFKCFIAEPQHDRSDGGVLYFPKEYFGIAAELFAEFVPGLIDRLGEFTPLFTKPVARGIGIAEDPSNGESFGQHRCRLIAEAVWQAYTEGDQSPAGRRRHFTRLLASNAVDPERWYLNSPSRDVYELPSVPEVLEAVS